MKYLEVVGMTVVKVTEIFKNADNEVYGYRLSNESGETRDVTAEQLKEALQSGQMTASNYKLTKDDRLIPLSDQFDPDDADSCYIMNKDQIAGKCNLFLGTTEKKGELPYDFEGIREWIKLRARFSCAADAKKFFETIGIKDAKDFIEVTHCVSLHDTFWIKKADSKLLWKDVSPFRHNYSEVISAYALEGIYIGNNEKNYFSPVVSTEGSFPHTWKYSPTGIIFIKAGSKYTLGGINSGREPYSEYFASQIASYLNFNHVAYSIRNHVRHDKRTDVVTECQCFTTEEFGTVTAHLLGLDSYEKVIHYCEKLSADSYKTCLDMLFLDCLLLNTDRHFSNIEFMVDNDTLRVVGMVPVFDNNYSLLPRFMEGLEVFNREDYRARDGRTFEELYQLVKQHGNYRKELIALKQYRLEKPPHVEISSERLAFLNRFLQEQVEYLLSSS